MIFYDNVGATAQEDDDKVFNHDIHVLADVPVTKDGIVSRDYPDSSDINFLFTKHDENFGKELKELLKDNTRPIFVAVDESGKVLAHAFCIFQQHINNNVLTDVKTLYIDDICVLEDCRGQHIGKQMYDYVYNFAKENGFYNITLNVWSLNEPAMKFYEACGLKPQKVGMETIL